jgi:hypothetical protein
MGRNEHNAPASAAGGSSNRIGEGIMKNYFTVCAVTCLLALVTACGSDTQKTAPASQGLRGESCQAKNDCKGDLACVNNTCTQNDFNIAVGAKQCVNVECSAAADCCEPAPANCDQIDTICEQYTEPGCYSSYLDCTVDADCTQAGETCDPSLGSCSCTENPDYDPSNTLCFDSSLCAPCAYACQNEQCVSACTDDIDCGSGTCDGGSCVQCKVASDCTSMGYDGYKCMAGACLAPCKKNEECPLFNSCNTTSGECEYVGCTSDHECQIAYQGTDNQDGRGATCETNSRAKDAGQPAKVCQLSCTADAECGRFDVCSNGSCVFIGCESDDECRAYLGLYPQTQTGTSNPGTAVCR